MNILDALDDPNVFAPHFRGGTWRPWRAFLVMVLHLDGSGASQ